MSFLPYSGSDAQVFANDHALVADPRLTNGSRGLMGEPIKGLSEA